MILKGTVPTILSYQQEKFHILAGKFYAIPSLFEADGVYIMFVHRIELVTVRAKEEASFNTDYNFCQTRYDFYAIQLLLIWSRADLSQVTLFPMLVVSYGQTVQNYAVRNMQLQFTKAHDTGACIPRISGNTINNQRTTGKHQA